MKNKHCVNCERELDVGQDDFCSDACRKEYIDGADAELITNASEPLAKPQTQAQGLPDVKTFADLLSNSGKKKTED